MEERKGTKVSFVTAILLFLLILAIVGFAICCVGMQKKCREEKIALQLEVEDIKKEVEVLAEEKKEKENIEQGEIEQGKYSKISLSDIEKESINEKLRTYITLPLRQITNIEYGKNFQYNVNLLKEASNKHYIVIHTMMKEIGGEFNQTNIDGEEVTGATAISVDKVNEYYTKIFGQKMNEQELLNSNSPYEPKIKDGMLYGSYPTGFGINPFELKAKTLEKNNTTGEYILKIDVLMKILKKENDYTTFDENVTMKYGEPNVLIWPEEYNYATLEIQYKEDTNGNNQLISLMFIK